MRRIGSVGELEALYGTPREAALRKVADRLTPEYRRWIAASRFCILSTVGPGGTDASPRGDDGPVVAMPDDRTLLLPDWRGNDRIDSLRNVVEDGRVSLLFMVPGSTNVVRVGGTAWVTDDGAALERFRRDALRPRTVMVIEVAEVYFQCARAILRSRLWAGEDQSAGLPTAGQILAAMSDDVIDGAAYDQEWPDRAAHSMW